ERKEPELPAEPGAHRAMAALIRSGKPLSHSSIGVSASTMISSLPFRSLRTRPLPVPSGITTLSRWIPIASMTAKILVISAMPTASSISPRPSRDVVRSGGLTDVGRRALCRGQGRGEAGRTVEDRQRRHRVLLVRDPLVEVARNRHGASQLRYELLL